MKTEEVKYVYPPGGGPLLVPKTKNNTSVYQETTISNNVHEGGVKQQQGRCCPSHLFSRIRLILSCLAIVACVIVIIILVTTGLKASNSREQAQEEEIARLKELVENQQTRLHRMQKELQFLVTRQKAYEAREESLRRRGPPISPLLGTGTGSNVWPSLADRIVPTGDLERSDDLDSPVADSDLPMIPRRDPAEETSVLDEQVDVDKLPRASPNKKRKGKLTEDQSNGDQS